jgi:uncharacterized membrane protein YciS (DUF1049 family)
MKRSLLAGFRAVAFAVGVFVLLMAMGKIEIKTSRDVALFILGLVVFWVVVEQVFLNVRKHKRTPPKAPHP